MFCPSCSTQANEGAKFCKACGINLNVITQALSGGVMVSDPLRDREFKRARKQITDGIHGTAVGAALLIAAALPYSLMKLNGMTMNTYVYTLSLAIALTGIVKLFRSIGSIVDAKVGPKLLDPALQPRSTGGLNGAQPVVSTNGKHSQRLGSDPVKVGAQQIAHTRPVSLGNSSHLPSSAPNLPDENALRPGTGRINREHSSPLRKLEKEDDLMSKLRN
ncbi:MAG TPA: zinc ribbon domain-containing protein [Blastocatellia bacterium]|nr:zinc ribbon domain-containing protein [Blastocatellia bacterium]